MKTAQCDIVQDLLPLYADGSLSQASVEFVDEHLAGCEECKTTLNRMQKETNIETQNAEITAPINDLKKRFFKRLAGALSIIIPMLIVALVLFVRYGLPAMRGFAPMGAEDLSVSVESGKVVITPKESGFNYRLYYIYKVNDDDTISMFLTYGDSKTQYSIAGSMGEKQVWNWTPFRVRVDATEPGRASAKVVGGPIDADGSTGGDNDFSYPARIVLDAAIREIIYAPKMSPEQISRWRSLASAEEKYMMQEALRDPNNTSLQGLIRTDRFVFESLGETVLIWSAE